MSASGSEIFAVLGRIHVLLRRDLNRITDIEWAGVNKAYAQEVVRLCSTGTHADLPMLGAKLAEMLDLAPRQPQAGARTSAPLPPMGPVTETALAEVAATARAGAAGQRYQGGLR